MSKQKNRLSCIIILLLWVAVSPCRAADAERETSVPLRIVSLGPTYTENIYLLGAQDRLVGCTSYCVRPAAAREKKKVGSVMEVDIEKIIALKPDLIVASGLAQALQLKQLGKIGFRVVRFTQPTSFQEICEQFIELGSLLGLEERAKTIIRDARSDVAAIGQEVRKLPAKRVFLQIGTQPLFASVPGSFTNDFIVLAGGTNVVGDQTSGRCNYEKVIVRDPEVILIAIMGSETGLGRQQKENWYRYPVMSAVRHDRVHLVDPDYVCSPSPASFVDALKIVARLIHPEIDLGGVT